MDDSAQGQLADLEAVQMEAAQQPDNASDNPIAEEFKKIGKAALGQLFGGSSQSASQSQSDDYVKNLKDKDDEFSKKSEAEIKAKIDAIYAEYAARRKKLKELDEDEEKNKEEQKKLDKINAVRVKQNIDPAVARTRTEVGRNFGAE